jgi:hypothetical protein
MSPISRLSIYRFGSILIGAAVCLGCSPEQQNSKDRFVPAAELARTALEAVLTDWQSGREPGPIDRLDVGVRVVDKQRKKGQTLDEFDILGEAPGEGVRCFAVRVKLNGPAAEEKVRFVVVGINPLWVFRQEDYESLSQWSCGNLDQDPANPPADSSQSSNSQNVEHDSIAEATGESSNSPDGAGQTPSRPGEQASRQNE